MKILMLSLKMPSKNVTSLYLILAIGFITHPVPADAFTDSICSRENVIDAKRKYFNSTEKLKNFEKSLLNQNEDLKYGIELLRDLQTQYKFYKIAKANCDAIRDILQSGAVVNAQQQGTMYQELQNCESSLKRNNIPQRLEQTIKRQEYVLSQIQGLSQGDKLLFKRHIDDQISSEHTLEFCQRFIK